MSFEVQMRLSYGWDNVWRQEDSDEPARFATREEAQQELDEFFESADYACRQGFLSGPYLREDYRIVEVDE